MSGDRQQKYQVKLVNGETVEVYGEAIARDGVLSIIEWYGGGGLNRRQDFPLVNVLWWKAKE
jgi:hypothetical protein